MPTGTCGAQRSRCGQSGRRRRSRLELAQELALGQAAAGGRWPRRPRCQGHPAWIARSCAGRCAPSPARCGCACAPVRGAGGAAPPAAAQRPGGAAWRRLTSWCAGRRPAPAWRPARPRRRTAPRRRRRRCAPRRVGVGGARADEPWADAGRAPAPAPGARRPVGGQEQVGPAGVQVAPGRLAAGEHAALDRQPVVARRAEHAHAETRSLRDRITTSTRCVARVLKASSLLTSENATPGRGALQPLELQLHGAVVARPRRPSSPPRNRTGREEIATTS